ncbi:hypothetical protein KIW84_030864 [Lathyrus oleraceus]|uniref:Uncharacterized protein n=1 Tax=Pisum sativum TaxID=3888 RepID=A0A9D5AUI4_PEA|nr:hypothetical protein KIW84_030864 [Pisum sativum]
MQRINNDKTEIFFSKNTAEHTKRQLVHASSFKETKDLGEYLGIPLSGRSPMRGDYQYIIDQVKAKLEAWKSDHQSFAGRVTLAKTVIEATPTYSMMTSTLPKDSLKEIQKIQRSFIWGDFEADKKAHTVSWDNITKPKNMGGLEIRNLTDMNKARLFKLGWSLRSGDNSVWCQVLQGKYGRKDGSLIDLATKAYDSSLWKSIENIWPEVNNMVQWRVGNGQRVNV